MAAVHIRHLMPDGHLPQEDRSGRGVCSSVV